MRPVRQFVTDLQLLTTALIWGLAFVAQRVGMEHVGPYTFNAIRFALGGLALVPVAVLTPDRDAPPVCARRMLLLGGAGVGVVLFVASSLQQVGLVYTTAGNAGFITGLYVVIVPLLAIGRRQMIGARRWFAVGLAAVGLYLLTVRHDFTINAGDLFVLGCALFYAVHVHLLDAVSPRVPVLWLAIVQYVVVALLSAAVAVVREPLTLEALRGAAVPIVYGGLGSISIAYTLQAVAQRRAAPTHAAIILSLEGVFAAVGGWLMIGETLGPRALAGCALMLSGSILSQLARPGTVAATTAPAGSPRPSRR